MEQQDIITLIIAVYTALSVLVGMLPESRFVAVSRAVLLDIKKIADAIAKEKS